MRKKMIVTQYWELLLAYPGVPNDTHMNGLKEEVLRY